MNRAFKVSEITKYINRVLSNDLLLSDVKIEGEISNFTHHTSGHMYFTLKDNLSQIKCVMFRSYSNSLDFKLKNGMKITARGEISVYERNGSYQLYVKAIQQDGLGKLHLKYEELKKKLDEEGYFDIKHKKDLPKYPKTIGIVTSETGAAIQDIFNILGRRYPIAKIHLCSSLVQGEQALDSIISALETLDKKGLDLIILARGGGSFEDLFVFNEESLVKTIFNLKTPIITGIGHEIDFTLSDFVSDLRAPTPSAAAELATPDINRLKRDIEDLFFDINSIIFDKINLEKRSLDYIDKSFKFLSPKRIIQNNYQELDLIYSRLNSLDKLSKERQAMKDYHNSLLALNPTNILERGYGLVLQDNRLLSDINMLKDGEKYTLILKNGSVSFEINNISREENSFGKFKL